MLPPEAESYAYAFRQSFRAAHGLEDPLPSDESLARIWALAEKVFANEVCLRFLYRGAPLPVDPVAMDEKDDEPMSPVAEPKYAIVGETQASQIHWNYETLLQHEHLFQSGPQWSRVDFIWCKDTGNIMWSRALHVSFTRQVAVSDLWYLIALAIWVWNPEYGRCETKRPLDLSLFR